jgi:hypothetical protein
LSKFFLSFLFLFLFFGSHAVDQAQGLACAELHPQPQEFYFIFGGTVV